MYLFHTETGPKRDWHIASIFKRLYSRLMFPSVFHFSSITWHCWERSVTGQLSSKSRPTSSLTSSVSRLDSGLMWDGEKKEEMMCLELMIFLQMVFVFELNYSHLFVNEPESAHLAASAVHWRGRQGDQLLWPDPTRVGPWCPGTQLGLFRWEEGETSGTPHWLQTTPHQQVSKWW